MYNLDERLHSTIHEHVKQVLFGLGVLTIFLFFHFPELLSFLYNLHTLMSHPITPQPQSLTMFENFNCLYKEFSFFSLRFLIKNLIISKEFNLPNSGI